MREELEKKIKEIEETIKEIEREKEKKEIENAPAKEAREKIGIPFIVCIKGMVKKTNERVYKEADEVIEMFKLLCKKNSLIGIEPIMDKYVSEEKPFLRLKKLKKNYYSAYFVTPSTYVYLFINSNLKLEFIDEDECEFED